MKIHVGTSGYGYKAWKGKFYPEKIAAGEMLRFYSERFGTVEINNTFYQMPKEEILLSWYGQVPEDFIFAIKAPQVITHLKQMRNAGPEMEYLFKSLPVLKRKRGPVLFQFPRSFRADNAALKDFLDLIPAGISCAFDFRSPSWVNAETSGLLRKKGCSLCIEDTDESPAEEITSTADWGYLRLRRSQYTDDDLSSWIERIFSQKWEKAFVFFKHEEEAKGPQMALRFQELADSALTGHRKRR
jgi:uncharacterized protein YecE (DUF72 family)